MPWHGAMEATLFSAWIYDTLKPYAAKLVMGHPARMKAISAGKKKPDAIDASTIADLTSVIIRAVQYCQRSWFPFGSPRLDSIQLHSGSNSQLKSLASSKPATPPLMSGLAFLPNMTLRTGSPLIAVVLCYGSMGAGKVKSNDRRQSSADHS
jgi:hypothetical protein